MLAAEHNDVFVVEGEKDVDNLTRRGFTATTNSGGAKKWSSDLNRYFAGKNGYLLADNDDVGADHMRMVAAQLLPVAHAVHMIDLPGLPPKGDVSDWFKGGGTVDQLADFRPSRSAAIPPRRNASSPRRLQIPRGATPTTQIKRSSPAISGDSL